MYRQYSVGPYILDFYCPNLRLNIEIDGRQHGEEGPAMHDRRRDTFLTSCNIIVVRYSSAVVLFSLGGVLADLSRVVDGILRARMPKE